MAGEGFTFPRALKTLVVKASAVGESHLISFEPPQSLTFASLAAQVRRAASPRLNRAGSVDVPQGRQPCGSGPQLRERFGAPAAEIRQTEAPNTVITDDTSLGAWLGTVFYSAPVTASYSPSVSEAKMVRLTVTLQPEGDSGSSDADHHDVRLRALRCKRGDRCH